MTGPKSLLQLMDDAANKIKESKGIVICDEAKPVSQADNNAMTVVFNQLMQVFPYHKKQFSSDDDFSRYKAQFIKGLIDSGIRRREQFEKAFKKARERIYPTLPTIGEFLSWCRREPEDYGYPTSKQALWEVVQRYRDISPAARIAGRKTKYERGTMDAKDYEEVFVQAYRDVVFGAVDNNRDLAAEVASAIEYKEPPKVTKASEDVGGAAIDLIHSMFKSPCIIKLRGEMTTEELERDRLLRVAIKRKKMGFSLSDDDKKLIESMKKLN